MKFKGLSNNQLKIIAMLAILFDHIGMILLPQFKIFRIIGRIAFPIFAYMIAEGCTYTRNKRKYLLLLSSLGIVCQTFYFIFTRSMYLNVLITFSLSVITIFCIDYFVKHKNLYSISIFIIFSVIIVFVCVIVPEYFSFHDFEVDYGLWGVLLPVAIHLANNKTERIFFTITILLIMSLIYGGIQIYSILSIPLLILYNGKRGKVNLKYLFYIFYPTHLVMIYAIRMLL